MIEHILGFVKKSGGIDKVEAAMKAMQSVEDHQKFLQRLAKNRDGARQLVAAAMLGTAVAVATYRGEQAKRAKDN